MPDSPYDVFISYRRSGGSALAQLVCTALAKRGFRVFMDVRELSAGPFDAALKATIEKSENVVILLTPGCLDRCAEEQDWFRQEIAQALVSKRHVVPLKTDDFQFPSAKELPKAAALLARHNCVTYVHEHSDASLDKLCRLLRRPRQLARRRGLVALAVAGLLIGGLGIWAGVRSKDNGPPPPPPRPKTVDLLTLVEVNRDRKSGEWTGNKSLLVGKGGNKNFFLTLPWDPPAEYRLHLKVTRLSLLDKGTLQIGLAALNGRFTIVVDGGADNMHTGLAIIDGQKPKQRSDMHKGRILVRGVPMELIATVRPELIQLESNGKLVYEWHGEMSRASRLSSHPGDPLFLGGNGGSFRFDQISLEPLTDDRGQSLINP